MVNTPYSVVRYNEFLEEHQPKHVIGIDEVAFGCFAGPLVVGAVVLPTEKVVEVQDSKRYGTEAKLRVAEELVIEQATYILLEVIEVDELNDLGLGRSLQAAFTSVAKRAAKKFPEAVVVVDGKNVIRQFTALPQIALPKADAYVSAVSCASVVAKVHQLDCMEDLDEQYPEYAFYKHHGYGTAGHRQALMEHGVTPAHRMYIQYIQKVLAKRGTYEE